MDARRRLLSGGLLLGNLDIGAYTAQTILVLTEDGADKDYIVIKHHYPTSGGGTLLLRKTHSFFGQYSSSNSHVYADSYLDFQLSSTLPGKFVSAIQNALLTVGVPMGGSTLSRKVFVLSGTELGLSDVNMSSAGSPIAYFTGNSARATGLYYWTRSADNGGSDKVFEVNTTGALESAAANTNANAYPCIVLPASTRVRLSGGKYYTT